jgi:hypothetical protein
MFQSGLGWPTTYFLHLQNLDPIQICEDLKIIHQACEFALRIALHHKFLEALKAKDQLISGIMMVQPPGVAAKMREVLTSSLPEIC